MFIYNFGPFHLFLYISREGKCFTVTFDALPSVEDQWIEELSIVANLYCQSYCFSGLYDDVDSVSRFPVRSPLIGLQKAQKYDI